MSDRSIQAQRIIDGARARWGDRWQSPLARLAGVPQSTLSCIASDDPEHRRVVTPAVARAVANVFAAEALRAGGVQNDLKTLAGELLADIEE